MALRQLFTPALARRIARATRHRAPLPPARSFITSSISLAPKRPLPPKDTSATTPPLPSTTALSTLLARLSLPANASLHSALIACLTHPSYNNQDQGAGPSTSTAGPLAADTNADSFTLAPGPGPAATNELLASLGNSLLGLFASEHLSNLYPNLPTSALQSAVTAHVGPKACYSVARELGVSVQNTTDRPFLGVGVRWKRSERDILSPEEKKELIERVVGRIPVAGRFKKHSKATSSAEIDGDEGLEDGNGKRAKREGYDEVVASAVKAFVGLIYQEQGMHAARRFTHAHFLSRHLPLTELFSFKTPKYLLSTVIAQHLSAAGVEPSEGQGKLESRLIASTGTNSLSPLFNVALHLPSGLKLSEGFGSSLAMAEHRAAVNALYSIFLVRGQTGDSGEAGRLPTSLHPDGPGHGLKYSIEEEGGYRPSQNGNGNGTIGWDALGGSSRRSLTPTPTATR